MSTSVGDEPKVVRLVVASPDRSRVLARPGGLAGWRLPAVAVRGERSSVEDWSVEDLERAALIVGGAVTAEIRVDADVWEFVPTDRVTAAGRTWIDVADADSFGADAPAVRHWVRSPETRQPPTDDGPSADGAMSR